MGLPRGQLSVSFEEPCNPKLLKSGFTCGARDDPKVALLRGTPPSHPDHPQNVTAAGRGQESSREGSQETQEDAQEREEPLGNPTEYGLLSWTAGVIALEWLVVRQAAWALRREMSSEVERGEDNPPKLAGTRPSPACSAADAIAKPTPWVVAMFGARQGGSARILDFLHCVNLAAKGGQPVQLSFWWQQIEICVYWDGRRITDPSELEELARRIEQQWKPRRGARAGTEVESPPQARPDEPWRWGGVDPDEPTAAGDRGRIEISIDRPFETFSDEAKETLLKAIEERLMMDNTDEVRVIKKQPGCVRLTVELPADKVDRLCEAVALGGFADLDVVHAEELLPAALPVMIAVGAGGETREEAAERDSEEEQRQELVAPSCDVLLTHSTQDRDPAGMLSRMLRQRDLSVREDEWDLVPLSTWGDRIEEELERVKAFCVVLGGGGFSRWREGLTAHWLTRARRMHVPVRPILVHGGPEPRETKAVFGNVRCLDLRDEDSRMPDALDWLRWEITGAAPIGAPGLPPRTPKRRMAAFRPPVARRAVGDTLDRVARATEALEEAPRKLPTVDLTDEALGKFWPSERRAIVVHQFYMGLEQRRDISISEAIASWEAGPCQEWRRRKMRRDMDAQEREIERHKYLMSESAGHDVGWEAAAEDWIANHAAAWREWWEERPEAGA